MITRTSLFFLAISVQVGLLLAIPFSPRGTDAPQMEGTAIRLAAEPGSFPRRSTGDVYTPRLRISNPEGKNDWRELPFDTPICAVLVPGEDGFHTVASIETRWPRRPPADAVILRGYTSPAGLRYDRLLTYRLNRPPHGDAPPAGPVAVDVLVSPNGVGRISAVRVDGRVY